jgi:hypothetical protein
MEKIKRKTKKKKIEPIPTINFDELYEKINNLINKDKFFLLAYSEEKNYFVILHKKKLTVKKVNENSVFQPVTFEEEKTFPIPFIIWVSFTKEEPQFIQDMKKFCTTIIKCLPMDDFADKIKRYVLKD